MSFPLYHSLQHVTNATISDTLPPQHKRRRLNSVQSDENTSQNRCSGATTLTDASSAIFGNVYETHNHPQPSKSLTEQEKSKSLVKSLAFKMMDARLHNVKAALKNTCEWLFRHRAFIDGIDDTKLSEHKGFLWMKGKPGCGKSTLMKSAYHWAKGRAKRQWIALSFFFNARAPGALEKSPLGLYRSLVHEILRLVPRSIGVFAEMFYWKDSSGDVEWTIEELQGFLLKFVESDERPSMVTFVDALDEGNEGDIRSLISFLEDLTAYAHQDLPLRVCLSSRHYPHITISTGLSFIVEKQAEHDRDIEKYVRNKLINDAESGMDDLRAMVCARATGIFLWVVLVLPILNHLHDQGKNVVEMRCCLQQLPKDLEGLFAEILARDSVELKSCVSLLQWVLYSNAPLNSAELYLAVQHSWHRPDEDVVVVPAKDTLLRYILHHSRGLVEITKSEPSVVQSIHETVRDFLAGEHGLAQVDSALAGNLLGWSHAKLAQACLSYLCQDCCSRSILSSYPALLDSLRGKACAAKVRELIPFLPYAATGLLVHAEAAQQSGVSQEGLLAILQTPKGEVDPNYLSAYNLCQEFPVRHYKVDVTMLYVAAEKGLPALTSLVLTAGSSGVNTLCGRYGNALQATCFRGNARIARLLLSCGANVNAMGGEYKSAFGAMIAAKTFHLFELLKAHGLKKDTEMPVNAFIWLDRQDAHAILQELLQKGISSYLPHDLLGTSLTIATRQSNIKVMDMLLQCGADINYISRWRDESGLFCPTTPLEIAMEADSIQAVDYLLKRSASIPMGPGFDSVLCAASYYGFENVVRSLLDRGANVNARIGTRCPALHAAANAGHMGMVRLLLDQGAKIDAFDRNGSTPLEVASLCGHDEIVCLLLDRGANIDVFKSGGRLAHEIGWRNGRGYSMA